MLTDETPVERFWLHVEEPSPYSCWEWTGARRNGYGRVSKNFYGQSLAHRVAYEFLAGPIPDRMQLDHLCRNPMCVNPLHLEPVTNQENARRGNTGKATGARNRAKTECPRGHAYDEQNTRVSKDGLRRACKTCESPEWRAWRQRAKAGT